MEKCVKHVVVSRVKFAVPLSRMESVPVVGSRLLNVFASLKKMRMRTCNNFLPILCIVFFGLQGTLSQQEGAICLFTWMFGLRALCEQRATIRESTGMTNAKLCAALHDIV